jgi:hypothetical protein
MPALATRIIRASPAAIEEARAVLAAGGLVAFPTETVYGLGADATDDAAVARLYAAKERPSFNPLIVHVTDLAAARRVAAFDDTALRLAGAFWPGPLTLVLRRTASCPFRMLATAGLDTVAVRRSPCRRDFYILVQARSFLPQREGGRGSLGILAPKGHRKNEVRDCGQAPGVLAIGDKENPRP